MDKISLRLSGVIPSKKNSRLCASRGGRIVNIPSASYTDWHKRNLSLIVYQSQGKPRAVRVPCALSLVVRYPDRRRRDLDNALSSVLDLLVDAGILPDDSWTAVERIAVRGELARPGEAPSADVDLAAL